MQEEVEINPTQFSSNLQHIKERWIHILIQTLYKTCLCRIIQMSTERAISGIFYANCAKVSQMRSESLYSSLNWGWCVFTSPPWCNSQKKSAECGDAADFCYPFTACARCFFFSIGRARTDVFLILCCRLPSTKLRHSTGLIADLASNCPRQNYISGCLQRPELRERNLKRDRGANMYRTHTHILLPPRLTHTTFDANLRLNITNNK
jgi:hypothetical protein